MIIDFSSPKARIFLGSFYVALTRVRNGASFYLIDFKPEYIQANQDVEKKLLSMITFSSYNFKKIYLDNDIFDGDTDSNKELKIGYINTNDLSVSSSDVFINSNANLLHLDILCVADTRLTKVKSSEDLERSLCNWSILQRFDSYDGGEHMGLLLLQSKNSKLEINKEDCFSKEGVKRIDGKEMVYVQIMRVNVCKLMIGYAYIRETPTQKELDALIHSFRNCDLVMGDFNLDPEKTGDQVTKLRQLCGSSRVQVLHEFTFRNFNQLDHIFLNKDLAENSYSTSFRNPTSDHRTITVRVPINSHTLSQKFKQEMNFDEDHWTKMKKMPHSENSIERVEFTLEIVNAYIELLRSTHSKAMIFHTHFIIDLLEKGFLNLDSSYKVLSIIEADSVIVPIDYRDEKKASFKGLLIWCKSSLCFYDPQSNLSSESIEDDMKLARWFVEEFVENLYSSLALPLPKVIIEIFDVEGENQDWVYLLTNAKYHMFGQHFDLSKCNLGKQHEIMSRELKSLKIIPLLKETPIVPVKRKLSDPGESSSSKKRKSGSRQHVFANFDQDSCWMNSCLQSMLAVLDHAEDMKTTGSTLLELLLWYKGMSSSTPINPSEVKDLMYSRERQRIIERHVMPQQRLFHFANTTSYDAEELDFQSNRRGQQDCKDFFVCIGESKEHWLDIFNLFKFSLDSYTLCSSCNQISRPETANNDQNIFLLNCPTFPINLSSLVSQSLNEPTLVEGWRHQEGCEQVTSGYNYRKIENMADVKFLIVIVERLIRLDNGNLQIVDSKIPVDGDIRLSDSNNLEALFRPVAVIHHTGHVNKNARDTFGHYRADILDADTDNWFQTSDDDKPLPIDVPTDQGYITILKKINFAS